VPEPVTLLGVMGPQVSPDGIVSAKVTVPVKWFRAVTVMVEVTDWPTSTALGEVALVEKSWNMNVAGAVCTNGVLVPVMVNV
jgi:hypothetical protein